MGPGILRGIVAAVSAHSLRVVGAVAVLLSTAVASISITTDEGLAVTTSVADRSTTVAADAGVVTAVVEFATAYPAYPVATVLGFVLLVVGDDAPLVGN